MCNRNDIFYSEIIGAIVSGLNRTQFITPMSVFDDNQPDDPYSRAIRELRLRKQFPKKEHKEIRYSYDE